MSRLFTPLSSSSRRLISTSSNDILSSISSRRNATTAAVRSCNIKSSSAFKTLSVVPATRRFFFHTNGGNTTTTIPTRTIYSSSSSGSSNVSTNLRLANSYHFQKYQFSSSIITDDESKLQTPSLAPSSLNILPTIPIALLQSIRQLPEVKSALAAITTTETANPTTSSSLDEVMDHLDRASAIFTQFNLPNEQDVITSLQAQILHDGGRYSEAVGKISLLRERAATATVGGVGASEEEDKDKERRLWKLNTLIQLQAKSQWYRGLFDSAEKLAVEASESSPPFTMDDGDGGDDENGVEELLVGLRQGCSINALALSKLAALDIRDERVVKLYQDDTEEDDTTRDWSKILRESDELKNMLGMASHVMFNDYCAMKQTTVDNSNINSNNSNTTDTTTTRINKNSIVVKLALASAASYCNQGIAEVLCLTAKRRLMGKSVSTDSAMHIWREAITVLDDLDQFLDDDSSSSLSNNDDNTDDDRQKARHHQYGLALAKSIRARVYCNMTWSILFFDSSVIGIDEPSDGDGDGGGVIKSMPINADQLKIASEYAGSALKLYEALLADDPSSLVIKPSMGRALCLVASCYAKAGSSVTAEGLFQSSLDNCIDSSNNNNPLTKLDARSGLLHYAKLCQNWENRDADAKKNADRTLEMDRSLHSIDDDCNGNGWQGKSGIYSGLWFFSIGDF